MYKHNFSMNENGVFTVIQVIDDFSKSGRDLISIKMENMHKRSNKPYCFYDKKDDQCVFFQELIEAKIDRKKITFTIPNEIALSMSIAHKSLSKSLELKKDILALLTDSKRVDFFDSNVNLIYDFLEETQKTIVFSYKAIEALCNSAIPQDYQYKKTSNKKGIHEVYDKIAIERWVSTSDKVSKILPEIYNCTSPQNKKFWGHFKKLEEMRNDIIHSKSNTTSKLLSELLTNNIDVYVKSCESLLLFFYNKDTKNPLFPLIPKVSKMIIVESEDLGEYVEKVE